MFLQCIFKRGSDDVFFDIVLDCTKDNGIDLGSEMGGNQLLSSSYSFLGIFLFGFGERI